MSDSSRSALRWLWIGPIGASLVLSAAGYGPSRSAAGRDGVIGMFAGQILVLAVVYVTLMGLVRRMSQSAPSERLTLALKTGLIRFLLTLFLAAGIAWQTGPPKSAFLVWVAISYVVLINVETVLLVRWMATLGK